MDEIDKEIIKIEDNILETVCHTPNGCSSLTWPLGVPPSYKATSRHEIIRYDYFNGSHILLSGDFDVYNEMTGLHFFLNVIKISINKFKN
jgi:hypothetical protein